MLRQRLDGTIEKRKEVNINYMVIHFFSLSIAPFLSFFSSTNPSYRKKRAIKSETK